MKKIAVYFPGIGYHCDNPLLYYSREAYLFPPDHAGNLKGYHAQDDGFLQGNMPGRFP